MISSRTTPLKYITPVLIIFLILIDAHVTPNYRSLDRTISMLQTHI